MEVNEGHLVTLVGHSLCLIQFQVSSNISFEVAVSYDYANPHGPSDS